MVRAFPVGRSASPGSSSNHIGHLSGFKITGIRLWISAHISLGVVVMISAIAGEMVKVPATDRFRLGCYLSIDGEKMAEKSF